MAPGRRPQDTGGDSGTRRLAQPHPEIEQGHEGQPLQQLAMGRLGRAMAGDRMGQPAFPQQGEGGDRRRRDIAVENDRHPGMTGRDTGAQHGGEFATAEAPAQVQGIVAFPPVEIRRRLDRFDLGPQHGADRPGARPDPARRRPAEQAGRKRRRRRRVADAHFTDAQKIDPGRDHRHAGGDGGEELRLVHRRGGAEIPRRPLEIEGHDHEIGADRPRQGVDRRPASGEIRHHLGGDAGGIGRDPGGGDAVVAGEDGDSDRLGRGPRAALPARQPDRQFFQPAKGAGGLGQQPIPRDRGRGGGFIAFRQGFDQGAEGGEVDGRFDRHG